MLSPYRVIKIKRESEYIWRLEDARTGRIFHTMTTRDPVPPTYLSKWQSKLNATAMLG